MTISTIDESQRNAARVAGFTGLFTMVIVVFANFGIHSRLMVAGNAAETARNILAHESLFRLGIACDLIYAVGTVVLLAALYVILKPVNRNLALLATFWRLIYAVTWVVIALNYFTALQILSGAVYARVFGAEQLQVLARLHLSGFDTYYVGLLFCDWRPQRAATCGASHAISREVWPMGCDRVRMVRDVYFRFHHLPRLLQGRQPVVVRFADGYFRDRNEFLASVQGIAGIATTRPNARLISVRSVVQLYPGP